MTPPGMIKVRVADAVLNAATDAFPFLLEPETFPVFYEWMKRRGKVEPDYTADMMRQDLATINGVLERFR